MRTRLFHPTGRTAAKKTSLLKSLRPRQFKILGPRDTAWFYVVGLATVGVLFASSAKTSPRDHASSKEIEQSLVPHQRLLVVENPQTSGARPAQSDAPAMVNPFHTLFPQITMTSSARTREEPPTFPRNRRL